MFTWGVKGKYPKSWGRQFSVAGGLARRVSGANTAGKPARYTAGMMSSDDIALPMAYNTWWTKKGERAWGWHTTTQPAGL